MYIYIRVCDIYIPLDYIYLCVYIHISVQYDRFRNVLFPSYIPRHTYTTPIFGSFPYMASLSYSVRLFSYPTITFQHIPEPSRLLKHHSHPSPSIRTKADRIVHHIPLLYCLVSHFYHFLQPGLKFQSLPME